VTGWITNTAYISWFLATRLGTWISWNLENMCGLDSMCTVSLADSTRSRDGGKMDQGVHPYDEINNST